MSSEAFDKHFSARLRQARESADIRQGLIADHLHVRQSTVSDWMHAKHLPGIGQLAQLADLLEVDLHWLITGRERPSPQEELVNDIVRAAPMLQMLAERGKALAEGEPSST